MRLARERDAYADAARLAAAVSQAPDEVRRLRAEIGRAGGLLRSCFMREDSDALLAGRFARELAEALLTFADAGRRAEKALESVEEKLAAVSADLELAARRFSGRM
jgi:hypothetical protein